MAARASFCRGAFTRSFARPDFADLVTGKNEPGAVFLGRQDSFFHFFKIHAVGIHPEYLGHIAEQGIVGSFVTKTAPGTEMLGHERNVALGVQSSSDEFLAARIGKGRRLHVEETLGIGVRAIHLVFHHRQSVVFQSMVARPGEISSAWVRTGVIANLVSLRCRVLPPIQAFI